MQDDLFSAAGADSGTAADPAAARAEWLRRELERHTVLYYRDAAPEIPDDIVEKTRARYLEALRILAS